MQENKALLDAAYGGSAPNFDSLSRKETLNKIANLDKDAKGLEDNKSKAKSLLENCLRDLSPVCIPESWIQH